MPIDTGAGSTTPALKPEKDTAARRKETATETAMPSELHQQVVDAELKNHARGERGALWLLLGVVVMAGGTGWLMSDFRSTELVAESSDSQPFVASAEEDLSTAPVISVASQVNQPVESSPEQLDDRQLSVADSADTVKERTEKDSEAEDVSAQEAAKAEAAAQQRVAELSRETEEIARLKKESDHMERERRAAEKRLVEQHVARKEFERKARLQQEKLAVAREAAKKLAEERTLAEKRRAEAAAAKSEQPAPVQPGKAVANLPGATLGAYDEDDGEAVLLDAKSDFANDTAEVGEDTKSADGAVDLLATLPAGGDGDSAIVQEEKDKSVEFAANPCSGPTARFLSTCR